MLILSYFWFGFVDSVFGISKVEMGFVDCGVDRRRSRGRRRGRRKGRRRKKTQMRDEGVRELMGILVFFGFATVIYKTRIARFDLWTPEGPYSFRVLVLVFYKSSKRNFYKKAAFLSLPNAKIG